MKPEKLENELGRLRAEVNALRHVLTGLLALLRDGGHAGLVERTFYLANESSMSDETSSAEIVERYLRSQSAVADIRHHVLGRYFGSEAPIDNDNRF